MKIIHITATHLNKYGGIPVVLEKLVKYQNEIKTVQSIVLSVKNDVKNINSKKFKFIPDLEHIKNFMSEYKPDVIIFHGIYFLEYIKISKVIKDMNLNYYIEPHGSFMKQAQDKGKLKKYIANKTVFNRFIKNAYGYIFLNEQEMRNSLFRCSNDLIIPNGIDVKDSNVNKLNDNNIKLFFIGRIDINHKGLDILIDNLKRIDNLKHNFSIDIYGVGNEKDTKFLNDEIGKFKNLDISFRGPVYDYEKENVLKTNNIMILTSRYEGFPMAILEALSYGNPCIVTEGTNVKTMIEENSLGWGCEYENIAESILHAVEDYQENKDFYINKTIEFVNENYSWRLIAKKSIENLSEKSN